MKDWEQIGRELRDEWVAERAWWDNQARNLEPDPMLHFELAMEHYEQGDPSRLIEYLLSDGPLYRQDLALALKFAHDRKRTGRPRNNAMRRLVDRVVKFYGEWRARNKREGINNQGLSERMKYESCLYLIEVDGPWEDKGGTPDPEAMMQLLARPKTRREPSSSIDDL